MTTTHASVPFLAATGPGPLQRLTAATFKAFCSLRLTVAVIIMMSMGCLVGMFVDQTKSFEEHARVWQQTPWKYSLYTGLEFHDVFHSWWFGLIILVLALNLTACSIERLPKIWLDIRHPDPRLTPKKERGIKHRVTFVVQDANAFLDAFLKGVGRAAAPQHLGGGEDSSVRYVFTEKHKWARTGVYVVHTALLLIMFGSMATTMLGFDGTVGVVEGQSNRFAFGKGPAGLRYRQDLGFEVACTDFRLKQFVDGAPMDFESDLIIYKDGKEMVRKTIQVNDPLEYGGFTLYQASYQPVPGDETVRLAITPQGGARTEHSVTLGTRIVAPDGQTAFVPLEIIPQYVGLGPALRVQRIQKGAAPSTFVVFQNYPEFDAQIRRGDFALHYKGTDKTYMTGVQVGRVPGVAVVFAGFSLMFVGLYVAFFMSHRRYWLRMERREDGSQQITLAGAAKRHAYAFEEEFVALTTRLAGLPGVGRVGRT